MTPYIFSRTYVSVTQIKALFAVINKNKNAREYV